MKSGVAAEPRSNPLKDQTEEDPSGGYRPYRRRFRAVPWMVVAAGLSSALAYFLLWRGEPAPRFKSVVVQKGAIALSIQTTGTVQPENRLNIQAPNAGRAEKVLADQGDRVRRGERLAWVSSLERAALLDKARSEGEKELLEWEELYKPTSIIAPMNGLIIQRNIQPGQTFTPSDPIFVMSDHLIVEAQVDETEVADIRIAQPATIVLDAHPQHRIEGKVHKVAFDAKTVNNVATYQVIVIPKKVPDFMRSGMTASVTFPFGSKKDVLWIPAGAVKARDGRAYVLRATGGDGPRPEEREITLGASQENRVEVLLGLSEGDVVLEPESEPMLKAADKEKSIFPTGRRR